MTSEGHLVAGRYRLIRRIGAGAMGVVYQGHDERLNRPIAVKKLSFRQGLSRAKIAEAVARCLREARLAARLHHPNAITLFDVVDEDDVPNLVMEYLPSRSLGDVLAEDGPLAVGTAATAGAQVASALATAHAAGIVHRDISPGNILLGEDGAVKLTDFGISRAADDVAVTKTGLTVGTPAYLAPEVALGAESTPASDVFSLGATLYTAVEGAPPFGQAPNVLAVLHAVACGKINPPQRSGALTDVLLALLTEDPHARPTAAQAHDLLADLDRGRMSAPPVLAVPPGETATPGDTAPAEDSTVLVTAPSRPTIQALPAPVPAADRSRKLLGIAGVVAVALVAVGLWILGSHNSVVPAQEQVPPDGTVHGRTTPTPKSAPVAPAGQPVGNDEAPAVNPASPAPSATTAAAVEHANGTTTPPSPPTTTTTTTTTESAPETTTSEVTTTSETTTEETSAATTTAAVVE
jgi:eukaryotic-like serine/threonine-protein kinase